MRMAVADKDPSLWSVEEVFGFLFNQGFSEEAEKCRDQLIDGQALLLLKVEHIFTFLDIKFGPALKIAHTIEILKSQSNSMRWESPFLINGCLTNTSLNTAKSNHGEPGDVFMFDDDQENPSQGQNPELPNHQASNENPRSQVLENYELSKNPEMPTPRVLKRNRRYRFSANPELNDKPKMATNPDQNPKIPENLAGPSTPVHNRVISETDFELNLEAFNNDLESSSEESESSSVSEDHKNDDQDETETRNDNCESDNHGEDNESDSEDTPVEQDNYRVEKILGKQIMPDGQVNYLLKYVGFKDKDNSWESKKNLRCPELIKQFEAENQGPVLYIVEKILKRRHSGGGNREYFVKWQGYDVAESTWEPLENLLGNETLYQFERNVDQMAKLVNQCSLCEASVDSPQQLRRHFLTAHPGGNPPKAKCLICNRHNPNLRKHLLDNHNVRISRKKKQQQ